VCVCVLKITKNLSVTIEVLGKDDNKKNSKKKWVTATRTPWDRQGKINQNNFRSRFARANPRYPVYYRRNMIVVWYLEN
jgi:hypothetical protein